MKVKSELVNELFKNKKEFVVNKKTIDNFFTKLDSVGKKLQDLQDKDNVKKERVVKGSEIKAEDLDMVAEGVMLDLGGHLSHADYIQKLLDDFKSKRIKHKPHYHTQKQVDTYKAELAKLFHSLSMKLRMALLFGFGEEEGIVAVVDTKKLPSVEQAKKMHKSKLKEAFSKATDTSGKVDNKSTKVFKKKAVKKNERK